MINTVEIARFTLIPTVSAEMFAPIAERFHTGFLALQPGYLRHDLLQTEDGWLDYVVWESLEAARAAAALIMESEASREFREVLATGAMEHAVLVKSWGGSGQ